MWLPAQCSGAQTKPGATQRLRASKGGTSQLSRSHRKHFHSPCSSELTQQAPKQGWSESHCTLRQYIVQLLWAHRTQHFQLDDCHSLFPEVHDRAVESFDWQKLEYAHPQSGTQDSPTAPNIQGLNFSRALNTPDESLWLSKLAEHAKTGRQEGHPAQHRGHGQAEDKKLWETVPSRNPPSSAPTVKPTEMVYLAW